MADFAQHLSEVLSCYFPDFHLKEEQRDVLEYLYEGRGDCLVSLPTGYGKSLLFQAAGPLLGRRDGVSDRCVLVLSPLNVIQRDQILSMTKRGITCCRIDTKGRPWTYIQEDKTGDQLLNSAQLESLDMLDDIVGPEVEPSSTQLSTSLMEIQQNENVDPVFIAAKDESHTKTVLHGGVCQQDDMAQVDRDPMKLLDPNTQMESFDLLDAIIGPAVKPSIPQISSRPMETQQNMDQMSDAAKDKLSDSRPQCTLQGLGFQHDITHVNKDHMMLLDPNAQVESFDLLDAIVGPEVEAQVPILTKQNENVDQIFVVTEDGLSESWPLTVLQGVVFQHDDITQVDSSLLEEDPMKVDTPDEDHAMWSPVTLQTISEPEVDGSPPHLCTTSVTEPQFYETEVSIEEVAAGKFTVILSHPEALLKEDGQRLLHSPAFGERIVALFVDECHTVEQWSDKFRTAYGKLHTLPAYFRCPIIGLSATITTASLEKLPPMMGMSSPLVIRVNPDTPNIFLERHPKPSNIDIEACAESIFKPFIDQLFEEGDDFPVTLLYMPVEWCSNAQVYAGEKFGYPDLYTTPYVAIYSSQDTEVIEHATQELKTASPHIRLVFCTSSVGMGFDSPCISRVVHAKPPRNIVDYVQQIGRAGRVGQPSTAILFFNASDIASNVKGIKESIVRYCRTSGCLRQSMLEPFGFVCSDSRSRCCSNCQ